MKHAAFAQRCLVVLAAIAPLTIAQQPPPQAEQNRMIAAMTDYANTYTDKLPNFVCQQITTQFAAGKNGNKWHKGDTTSSKLVFNGGREERTLELVNNKAVQGGARRPRFRTNFSSEGEFGILLSKIFDPASNAQFSWAGWDTAGTHQAAKIDYAIDLQHSSMELVNYIKAKVAYHGSVFIDPAAGTVYRVTSGTTEIPEELQMKSIFTTIDYDPVTIGTQSYLLPVRATVTLVTDRDQVKNEIAFTGYRKFEAESTVSFGSEDGATKKPPK